MRRGCHRDARGPSGRRNILYLVCIRVNFLAVIWTVVFQDELTGES